MTVPQIIVQSPHSIKILEDLRDEDVIARWLGWFSDNFERNGAATNKMSQYFSSEVRDILESNDVDVSENDAVKAELKKIIQKKQTRNKSFGVELLKSIKFPKVKKKNGLYRGEELIDSYEIFFSRVCRVQKKIGFDDDTEEGQKKKSLKII